MERKKSPRSVPLRAERAATEDKRDNQEVFAGGWRRSLRTSASVRGKWDEPLGACAGGARIAAARRVLPVRSGEGCSPRSRAR